jgi:histidine triad (HIT) family protein
VPFRLPERDPCPYCENFVGRYAWHGPPATVFEDDEVFVFLAPAPMGGMPGHLLVTTRRHAPTIFDLRPDEIGKLFGAVADGARALRTRFDPDGIVIQQNNGAGGFQTVPHIHVHVIPKTAEAPIPPATEVPVVPNDERVALAEQLRAVWPV